LCCTREVCIMHSVVHVRFVSCIVLYTWGWYNAQCCTLKCGIMHRVIHVRLALFTLCTTCPFLLIQASILIF